MPLPPARPHSRHRMIDFDSIVKKDAQNVHVCPLVAEEEKQLAVVSKFLRPALTRGERCVVGATAENVERIFDALARQGIDVARQRERGALVAVTDRNVFLEEDKFSPGLFLDFLGDQLEAARDDGFPGLRCAGVMTWVAGPDMSSEKLIEYEARLNRLVESNPMSALCLYDRSKFDPAIIHDVLRTHPVVLVGDRILDNPYYEPAELLLDPLPEDVVEFKRKRVKWWIGQLESVMEVDREREHLVAQLRQSQRMEALGRLAGGVAHDFNNLLTTITGFTDLLLSELEPDAPVREYADEIRDAAARSTSLTEQLLTFSRNQVLRRQVSDPRRAVRQMKKLLRRLIGEDIELAVSAGGRASNILVDVTQLEQVVLNLAINARDAMPGGGTLTIRVVNERFDRPFRHDAAEIPPGRYVVLSVSDTGTGIPTDVQPHIFEPFFTTKPTGSGTGLGLATVWGIVRQSGGEVLVDSRTGKGTTFSVYFPEAEEIPEEDRPHPVSETPGTAAEGKSVLVVEDEESVRALLSKLLPRLGYRVLEAKNGREGLELWRAHHGEINLVLTDVVMPEMGGPELGARLRKEMPELPVVFMSGYADQVSSNDDLNSAEILKKPFTSNALRQRLQEALSGSPAATGPDIGKR